MPRYWVSYALSDDEGDCVLVTTKDRHEAEQLILSILPDAEILEVKED